MKQMNYQTASMKALKCFENVRKTIKDLKSSLNYEAERMNAMGFLKLTTMTPEQWGYTE